MDFGYADCLVVEPDAMKQRVKKYAQKLFLSQRDRILAQVPASLKSLFQQVGFVDKQPVLALGPFHVPPGPIRKAWIERFVELKDNSCLEELPLIIYRYGHQESCKDDAYSLVDASAWIPYEVGTERNYDQIPKHIQLKLLSRDVLKEQDEMSLKPLRDMKEDLDKMPADRHGGYCGFTEIYDFLTISFPPLDAALKIGSHVEVYMKDRWHKASVEDINHNFAYLRYLHDKQQGEWLPLGEHNYRVLPTTSDGDEQVKLLDPQTPRPGKGSVESGSSDIQMETSAPNASNQRKQRRSRKVSLDTKISSGSSRPSIYLQDQEERLTANGMLYPKSEPRRLSDGKYAKPPGRNPSNMTWDAKKGVWTMTTWNATGQIPSQSMCGKTTGIIDPNIIRKAREYAKSEFEKIRLETLAAIPDAIKSQFGQIGFSKWVNMMLPVLVLNPFDVPPGQVRDRCLDMFEETKEEAYYLVFWYGAKDPDEYYGFIEQKAFIPYREGVEHMYHQIPCKIQRKIDGGLNISKAEEDLVSGIKEMQEDLVKLPVDRRRGVIDFPEWDTLLTEQDLVELGYVSENEVDKDREMVVKNQDVETAEHKPSQIAISAKRKMGGDGVRTPSTKAERDFRTWKKKKFIVSTTANEHKMAQNVGNRKARKKPSVKRRRGFMLDNNGNEGENSDAFSSENELYI